MLTTFTVLDKLNAVQPLLFIIVNVDMKIIIYKLLIIYDDFHYT